MLHTSQQINAETYGDSGHGVLDLLYVLRAHPFLKYVYTWHA